MRNPDRSLYCSTCGRARRPLELQRPSWSARVGTVPVAIPENPTGQAWQSHNDLIVGAHVYRNGGTGSDSHLCDVCLTAGLRALKVEIDRALGACDASTDRTAELADLTRRLSLSQLALDSVRFDHNRMQTRLAAVVGAVEALVAGQSPKGLDEILSAARWEVERGPVERER